MPQQQLLCLLRCLALVLDQETAHEDLAFAIGEAR